MVFKTFYNKLACSIAASNFNRGSTNQDAFTP